MRVARAFALLFLSKATAIADTVVLASGRRIDNVVVSRADDQLVVINPWNSRQSAMTFGIPAEDLLERAKVREVLRSDPPRQEYLARAVAPKMDAQQHFELAERCRELGLKRERAWQLERALRIDPTHAAALAAFGEAAWRERTLAQPELRADVDAREREYLAAKTPEEIASRLAELEKLSIRGLLPRLERARRSASQPRGVSDSVPLSIGSETSPGATYCLFVPKSYDPLEPTPLVVGLHGGGPGGLDRTLVTGSGEMAMPLYADLAERSGFLVVCPTAQTAPWPDASNEVLLSSVLREVEMLFNVDLTRLYLTGHSLGGYGTWHFAVKPEQPWAACAACSGGGDGAAAVKAGVPLYIYHGAADAVAPVEMDRAAARLLLAARKKKSELDFVYTELDGVGHDLPDPVREEIFRWFSGRARTKPHADGLLPESSFDLKVTREEIETFGDPEHPAAPAPGERSIALLLAELRRGGGCGRKARRALAKRVDEATAAQVAAIFRDAKANRDARLLAVQVLGDVAQPFCVQLLAPAIEDRDWRVVDAAVAALGAIGGPDCAPALERASARLARFFAASFLENNIVHVEYAVRLKCFEHFLQACERVGSKDALLACIERDVVVPVLVPKTPYLTPDDQDPNFANESAQARLALGKALESCLVAFHDARGLELLRQVRKRWSGERALVAELDRGIAELGG